MCRRCGSIKLSKHARSSEAGNVLPELTANPLEQLRALDSEPPIKVQRMWFWLYNVSRRIVADRWNRLRSLLSGYAEHETRKCAFGRITQIF
jgi:hypothetical protein